MLKGHVICDVIVVSHMYMQYVLTIFLFKANIYVFYILVQLGNTFLSFHSSLSLLKLWTCWLSSFGIYMICCVNGFLVYTSLIGCGLIAIVKHHIASMIAISLFVVAHTWFRVRTSDFGP